MAGAVGARAHLGGRQRADARRPRTAREVLRARDAAVPERRAAHRAPEELRARRRDRPLPPPHRPARAAPDGLRRVRPARREQRDQDRRAPARRDRPLDRRLPPLVPLAGASRSTGVASSRTHEPTYYRWTQWIFLQAVRARPGLPQEGGGQVVPARPDRARQRAGDRRPLRALRRTWSSCASSSSGSSGSPTTPTGCSTTSTRSTGPSTSRRCSATGSAAARAPRSCSAARSSGSTIRCSRRGPTRCSARPSS